MDWLTQDFGYALRYLRKRWGVTSVAVLVMALGISLTASMYAIIKGVILSGPDYDRLDEIVLLQTTIPLSEFNQSVRMHDYLDWNEQQTVFESMAAYFGTSVNLSGDDTRAETFGGVRMTSSTFDLLGKYPLLGRTFTPEEDQLEDLNIVILSYNLWDSRYDQDPGIIGQTIRVNAEPHTVIAVMPEGFRFPELSDIWLPLGIDPGQIQRREGAGLQVLGKPVPGITLEEVRTQFTTIGSRLTQQFPEANENIVPVAASWMDEQFVDEETKGLLYTMFVAVIGVLLIACANVANLLFALTVARGKELAVRTALGAGRKRVLRQLMSETLVLATGGALLGLILSKFSLDYFTRVITPMGIPPWMTFDLSPAVLVFVIGITFVAALASGLLPALHATKGDVHGALQDQSRGSSSRSVSRWSAALVVLEVSLSCALLVGAGLMVRSTLAVGNSTYGMNRAGILTARILLPANSYPDSTARQQFTERLTRELEALPGAGQVAVSSNFPVTGTSLRFYGVRDHDYVDDGEYPWGGYTYVSPTFFDVLEVPLVAGRHFNNADALSGERVIIVDERFVERHWAGEDVLGKQIRMGRSDSENPWMRVVGVVRTLEMLRPLNFGAQSAPGMYVPIGQQPVGGIGILMRTQGDPLAQADPIQDLIARLDPDIPVNNVNTLVQRVEQATLDMKIIGGMFTIFGIVALLLASIGLYAVMAFSVSRRTAEMGIRMALGANGGTIQRLIVSQGVRPVAVGMVLGLGLAVLLGMALSSFLFQVSSIDPLTFVGIPILLSLVSLVALLVPANRASRITPVVALREE